MRKGLLLFCVMLFLCGTSWALDLFVDSNADTLNAVGTRANPFPTIQAAINRAFSYDPADPAITNVTINVISGIYPENLIIDFGTNVTENNYVEDLSIVGENNDPSFCSIIGQVADIYTIIIKGNPIGGIPKSSFTLSGFTIKHVNNQYGIYYDSGLLRENTIDYCRFENCGCGAISDYGYYYPSTTSIQNSVFIGQYDSDLSAKFNCTSHDNHISIENCEFIGCEDGKYWLNFLYNPNVTLSNNQFSNMMVHFQNHSSDSVTGIFVYNNKFEYSSIQVFNTNISVTGNTFNNYCSSLPVNDSYYATLKLVNDHGFSRKIAEIKGNIFALIPEDDYHPLPIRVYKSDHPSRFFSLALIISNNSFLQYPVIMGIPVDTNHATPEYQVQISLFNNNMLMGNTSMPFTIFDLNGNLCDLPQSAQFNMDYCLFQQEIINSNSYLIGDGVINGVPANESIIEVDPEDITYNLPWGNDYRSPLIMSGYYLIGSNRFDRPDIGAIQYSGSPHEFTTYEFPSYSQRNGLKWMSFPTLDRIWNPTTNEPDVALTFFEPIMDDDVLFSINWKPLNYDEQYIRYFSGDWIGDTYHLVIPQQGYKIQMAQGLQNGQSIAVPGIIPDVSEYPVNLMAFPSSKAIVPNNENWLGYFHPVTLNAREAFGDVMDNLWSIQTQNWTMVREHIAPNSRWIIAYQNGKEPTLSYGDMVVVKCFSDDQFCWNNTPENQIPIEKELPIHFVYEEKPDYVPLYVEMDSGNLPGEIALFVNDVCMGAAVVCDSLVEVPVYILGNPDPNAEVEIRAYYEDKAAVDQIPTFMVWNSTNGVYENKPLVLNPKNYYYKVKLVQREEENPTESLAAMDIYPNPFNPSTTIKFNLPEATEIKLEIYNLKGQLIRNLAKGAVLYGKHSIIWNGTDNNNQRVASGLYYSKLIYQNKTIENKMVMLK